MESNIKENFLSAHDAYSDALFRHCYFRVFDKELATDLVQETFCRTWISISEGKKIDNVRAFLYRVLHNLIVDHIRKKKAVSLDQMMEDGFAPQDTSLPDLEERMIMKDIVEKLEKLDDSYREIIQMRYIDDLSIQEIGAILGISENAVSVRVHRGVAKFREMLEEEENKFKSNE